MLAVEYMGADAFQAYRTAVVVSGLVLVALAVRGIGASVTARVFSGATGLVLLAYGAYLWFWIRPGQVYVVYAFLFILPALVLGYHLYSRVENRKIDAAVRAEIEAERAARRAARSEPPPPATPPPTE